MIPLRILLTLWFGILLAGNGLAKDVTVEKGIITPGAVTMRLTVKRHKVTPYCRGTVTVTDLVLPAKEWELRLPAQKTSLGHLELKAHADEKSPCKKSTDTYTAEVTVKRGSGPDDLRDGVYVVAVNGEPMVRLLLGDEGATLEPFGCRGKTVYVVDEKEHKCRKAAEHECGPHVVYDDMITCRLINREVACDPRYCDPK